MNLQKRLEVQGATQQWVDSFMQANNIPADMMEDALTKVLMKLKDQVVTDLLMAAAQAQLEQEMPQEDNDD